jgi:hypothetical protein
MGELEPDEMVLRKRNIKKQLQRAGYAHAKIEYKDFLLPNISKALIKPVIAVGDVLERIPLIKMVTQSIFILAQNK